MASRAFLVALVAVLVTASWLRLESIGVDMRWGEADVLAGMVKTDLAKWAAILRDAGITPAN